MVGESEEQGVRSAEVCPRQGGMGSRFTGCSGKQQGPADVGHKADGGFGHAGPGPFCDHTDGTVGRDAYAPAEHQPVHEGDVRLGVVGNQGVEAIFVSPEVGRLRTSVQHVLVDGHDVAAGAQATISGPLHQDIGNGIVISPGSQLLQHGFHHARIEGVDCPGPVERHDAQVAAALEEHVFLLQVF